MNVKESHLFFIHKFVWYLWNYPFHGFESDVAHTVAHYNRCRLLQNLWHALKSDLLTWIAINPDALDQLRPHEVKLRIISSYEVIHIELKQTVDD